MIFGFNDKRFFHNFVGNLIKNKDIKLINCNQLRNIIHIDDIFASIFDINKKYTLYKKK